MTAHSEVALRHALQFGADLEPDKQFLPFKRPGRPDRVQPQRSVRPVVACRLRVTGGFWSGLGGRLRVLLDGIFLNDGLLGRSAGGRRGNLISRRSDMNRQAGKRGRRASALRPA